MNSNNNLQKRAEEQALYLALSLFHSTLLIWVWNSGSHKPSGLSDSHCLHYNITFTVITSRTNKRCHWFAYLWWYKLRFRFVGILLGYYWNTCWSFYFRDWIELAPCTLQATLKSMQWSASEWCSTTKTHSPKIWSWTSPQRFVM